MITLSIKKVSKKYNEKVRKYNEEVKIRKYFNKLGFYNKNYGEYKEEYKYCYLLEILYLGSDTGKVFFAYKSDKNDYSKTNYKPDIIKGIKKGDHEVEKTINEFCSKYGQYLLQGYDIVDMAENDPDNTLNYKNQKVFQLNKSIKNTNC